MLSVVVTMAVLPKGLQGQPVVRSIQEHELDRLAVSQELIDAINSKPGLTWAAGRSSNFDNATLRDVQRLCGAKAEDAPALTVEDRVYATDASVLLDDEFDWRSKSDMCPSILDVRDQANCGSCWALASAVAMTDRICIATKGAHTPRLSAQDLTSCSKPMGCEGGAPVDAWRYFQDTGVVTGGNYGDHSLCFSYQRPRCSHHSGDPTYPPCPKDPGTTPDCTKKCEDGEDWEAAKVKNTMASYFLGGESDLMQDLVQKGPISVVFNVLDDFPAYRSGIYDPQSYTLLGGHAVALYGYGNEGGVKYWLVKNSWNEKWGENGYFRIIRGKNACGIEGGLNSRCRPTAADVRLSLVERFV